MHIVHTCAFFIELKIRNIQKLNIYEQTRREKIIIKNFKALLS
jgi:hypothetical protein